MERLIIVSRVIYDPAIGGTPPVDPSGSPIAARVSSDRFIRLEHLRSVKVSVRTEQGASNQRVVTGLQATLQIANSSASAADEEVLVALIDSVTSQRCGNFFNHINDNIKTPLLDDARQEVLLTYMANADFD